MSKSNTATILYCATSGFIPAKDVILEVAAILVDMTTLDVVDTFSQVAYHPAGSVSAPDFHEQLVVECADALVALPLSKIEGLLLAGPWSTSRVLAGRALDFPAKFMAAHMPALHKALRWCLPYELKSVEALAVARGAAPWNNTAAKTYRAADEAIAQYTELVHWTTNK